MTASLLGCFPQRPSSPERPGGHADGTVAAAAVAVHLGHDTDSRMMSHTLGISDGCLQLGEADVGIPQLGLARGESVVNMATRARCTLQTDVAVLSLSLSSKHRSLTVVICFDAILQCKGARILAQNKNKKESAVWCRKRGRKRGRLLRWEFQELRFC